MELTSLKEFYEKSEDKNISLYLEYLASVKKNINEGMEQVTKTLGEEDNLIDNLKGDIITIESLETIIRDSKKELVSSSIAIMSDEELNSIIDSYINNMEKEYEELEKKYEELDQLIADKTQEHINKMEEFGYEHIYYLARDTKEFFEGIKSDEDFIMELVKSGLDREELMAKFGYCYTIDSVRRLVGMIFSLRKIVEVSDDSVLRRAIITYLTPEKIGNIICQNDRNEGPREFETLQKELKMQTEFFNNLPDSLKKEIEDNGVVDNETYDRLASIYSQYKADGNVVIPENEEVSKYKEELENINKTLEELNKKIDNAKKAGSSRAGRIKLVESLVEAKSDEKLTYASISTEALEKRNVEKWVKERIKESSDKLNELDKIQIKLDTLLSMGTISSKNEEILEFDILDAQRECKTTKNLGENYEDEEIEKIIQVERRRLEQFKILGEGIVSLKEIQKHIKSANKTFFISIMFKDDLLVEYEKKVKDIYDSLDKENLLRIDVDDEEEITQKPKDFDEFLAYPHISERGFDDTLYEEIVAKGLFNESKLSFEYTADMHYQLAKRLFEAIKKSDGTYDFIIRSEIIDRLIHLQNYLISLYEDIQSVRAKEKELLTCLANEELSEKFRQLVSDLGMNLSTVTREDVKKYQEDIIKQINDTYAKYDMLMEMLNLLNCDRVDSRYEMLNGLENTYMSPDEVKKVIRFN